MSLRPLVEKTLMPIFSARRSRIGAEQCRAPTMKGLGEPHFCFHALSSRAILTHCNDVQKCRVRTNPDVVCGYSVNETSYVLRHTVVFGGPAINAPC